MTSRRKFIQRLAWSGALSISLPEIVSAAGIRAPGSISLNPHDIILFQGDSITDAKRDRQKTVPNDTAGLGSGYANIAASQILLQKASLDLQIWNKGISGNKVYQLADRWDPDCLQINPQLLSILIGVNDYWHTLAKEKPYQGTVETYEQDYRKLLERTRQALPNVQLVIGEPFALNHVKAVTDDWFPAFNRYREAARRIAQDFQAIFIPYQQVFDEAIKKAPAPYWTGDGVHPSLAGAALMGQAWLQATGI